MFMVIPCRDDVERLPILPATEAHPRNTEGAFIDLRDGSLAFAWSRFTGGRSDQADGDIAKMISHDGGVTWSPQRLLIPNVGGCNVMSVSLLRLHDGRIAVFYAIKNNLIDCQPFVCFSDDELKTLSAPTRVSTLDGYHVLNNDRVIQTGHGRLIVPTAYHANRDAHAMQGFEHRGVMRVFLSDNTGATWRISPTQLEANDPNVTLQEPGIVELGPGRLMMWMRTNAGAQYRSDSFDDGETWSPPQPTDWLAPLSPASIKRMPHDGRLIMVWNDHSAARAADARDRTPLVAAASDDDGRTWRPRITLYDDPQGAYAYIAIHFLHGDVLLAHTDGGLSSMSMTRFPQAALRDAPSMEAAARRR